MPYQLLTTPPAAKQFRKFPPSIRSILVTEVTQLADSPQKGEILKGQLRAYRSLHIKIKNVQYRVIYEISEPENSIFIHAVGTRANFYIKLQRKSLKV